MAGPSVYSQGLISHYINVYREKYGKMPIFNRSKAVWSFDSMLYDLETEDVKNLLSYYMETLSGNNHSLGWFFNNYNDLYNNYTEYKDARDRDAKVREATRKRTEEWKRRTSQ